ncbi:hypothetical protein [Actinokineospora sp. HUAS TT18]|uniref:hypothetical protein n=1 Tax=Actinokineospora sp. HUAS TT18 TaxID=3447451 RepID=UPI003F520C81
MSDLQQPGRRVAVFGLGGTIAMTKTGAGGVVPPYPQTNSSRRSQAWPTPGSPSKSKTSAASQAPR